MYQDYKLAVQLWQAKDEAEQYEVKLRINDTNKTIVNAFCDVRFPTRDVDEQHIATFIQNCVQHWVQRLSHKTASELQPVLKIPHQLPAACCGKA